MSLSPSLAIAILVSFILAMLPVVISFVQMSSVEKQINILASIKNSLVGRTEFYALAEKYFDAMKRTCLQSSYRVPIIFFTTVVLFLSSMTFLGASSTSYFEEYSVILGGMNSIGTVDVIYQKGTFVVCAWAFIGSYVYLLYRLISRINNNDIYPITFYYYTNRLVIACLVAGVARHTIGMFGMATNTSMLAFLGFAIGWRPDLWLATFYTKFTSKFRVVHGQIDAGNQYLPARLTLDLLQGMSNDDRERLEELDIRDCHDLANQNPFIIFARTSYPLLHVIDWMAQAQLAVVVGEKISAACRSHCIRDIFIFEKCLLVGSSNSLLRNIKYF